MSTEEPILNTAFYEVFKEKLHKQKEALKKELTRAKSDRRKEFIKREIKEAKSMRNLLKKMEKQMGKISLCPHCGKRVLDSNYPKYKMS